MSSVTTKFVKHPIVTLREKLVEGTEIVCAFLYARCYDHEFVIASPIVYDHGCVPIRQRHQGCDPIGAVIIDVIHLHSAMITAMIKLSAFDRWSHKP